MTNGSKTVRDRPNRALGLLAAVAVAWALLVPLPLFISFVDSLLAKGLPFRWPSFGEAFVSVILMGVVGLPLSFVFCFLAGLPAWLIASRRGLRRPKDAAVVGALVGMVLNAFWLSSCSRPTRSKHRGNTIS